MFSRVRVVYFVQLNVFMFLVPCDVCYTFHLIHGVRLVRLYSCFIYSVCIYLPILEFNTISNQWCFVSFNSKTTGASSGVGTTVLITLRSTQVQSVVFHEVFCRPLSVFNSFSFGLSSVCQSSIDCFWWPLWYLQICHEIKDCLEGSHWKLGQ